MKWSACYPGMKVVAMDDKWCKRGGPRDIGDFPLFPALATVGIVERVAESPAKRVLVRTPCGQVLKYKAAGLEPLELLAEIRSEAHLERVECLMGLNEGVNNG